MANYDEDRGDDSDLVHHVAAHGGVGADGTAGDIPGLAVDPLEQGRLDEGHGPGRTVAIPGVASLPALWRDRRRSNAAVEALAERHVADIDAKIAAYRAIRHTLVDLIARCHGDGRPDCPILDTLERAPATNRGNPKQ
ncbi:MAG: hypothetical protein EXQ92_07760 [Alphaproteobacteria bacterium]|nr:hypothetical protein [Alphaproteobacteria bacterium]